jgi:hypothetical protein
MVDSIIRPDLKGAEEPRMRRIGTIGWLIVLTSIAGVVLPFVVVPLAKELMREPAELHFHSGPTHWPYEHEVGYEFRVVDSQTGNAIEGANCKIRLKGFVENIGKTNKFGSIRLLICNMVRCASEPRAAAELANDGDWLASIDASGYESSERRSGRPYEYVLVREEAHQNIAFINVELSREKRR